VSDDFRLRRLYSAASAKNPLATDDFAPPRRSYRANAAYGRSDTAKGEPSMSKQHYTTRFSVDQSPEQVFDAINNVRGRWSGEISGRTDKLGAEFTYRYQDLHRSTQKITELVPGQEGRLARPGRKDQFR